MVKDLEYNVLYTIGDFLIQVKTPHEVRITTDRGTTIVKPQAHNCVLVESSKNVQLNK